MLRRTPGPQMPVLGGATGPWLVLAVSIGAVAVAWLGWLAACIAAVLSGGRVTSFGGRWLIALVLGRPAQTWPGTPTALVVICGLTLVSLLALGAVKGWPLVRRYLPQHGDPVAELARGAEVTEFSGKEAASKAIRLRPSLSMASPRQLAARDTGLLLGHLKLPTRSGPALYASWEDTTIAVMAPRSGKTTALAIPHVLSAPGPVVATSVRSDLWAATSELRAQVSAAVWVFDPQRVTGVRQSWWWDPLDGLRTKEAAIRLAAHFVTFVEDESRRDIWAPAAKDLLCALFLAAGTSGRTLRNVDGWLADPASPVPSELLARAGFGGLAASLRGMQHGAPETRDGIYQTARTAAACLNDEDVLPWVTPPLHRALPAFDPRMFAGSRDTLYLITEAGTPAAPLIAAMADAVMRAGRRLAEQRGGRLDPPMVAVLDEAANICRIPDLPSQYSHVGGRGIVPVTILQSYEQGEAVWGTNGMAALWGAATKKLIGAGVDSPRLARDIAALVGQYDVPVRSVSYGDGRANVQVSLRRQEILEPADVRALPPGTALLFATGSRAALVQLCPWYQSPDSERIAAATGRAETLIQRAALEGPAWESAPGLPESGGGAGRD